MSVVNLKAEARIDEEFACKAPSIRFPTLKVDGRNIPEWRSKANGIVQLAEALLEAQSNVFWSSICLEPDILKDFDHVLENFPFFSEVDDGGLIKRCNLTALMVSVFEKIWLVFMRICGCWKIEGVSEAQFRDVVQKYNVLSFKRFRIYAGLYARNFGAVMKRVFARLQEAVPQGFGQCDDDVQDLVKDLRLTYTNVTELCSMVTSQKKRDYEKIFTFLDHLHKTERTILSWCEMFRLKRDLRPSDTLVEVVVETCEQFARLLSDIVLVNACAGSSLLLTSFSRHRSFFLQALTLLFARFYENGVDESDQVDLLYNLRDSAELLVRLNDRLKLKEKLPVLAKKSGMDEHVNDIQRHIDQSISIKAEEIVQSLQAQGYLDHLGTFTNPTLRNQVNELKDFIPKSTECLHLALRHFGYDMEKTLNALIEGDQQLPFNLRTILKDPSTLKARQPPRRQMLLITESYCPDSDIDSDPEEVDEKAATTEELDIVALLAAPPRTLAAPKESVQLTAKEQKARKTEDRLKKLLQRSGDVLNMRELKGLVDKMQEIRERKKEDSTVTVGGKQFAKLYKEIPNDEPTEKDRAVLRQKMEAYKYELSDEDDQDGRYDLDEKYQKEVGLTGRFNRGETVGPSFRRVYEDEYDDTYDEAPVYVEDGAGNLEDRHKATETGEEGTQGSQPRGGYLASNRGKAPHVVPNFRPSSPIYSEAASNGTRPSRGNQQVQQGQQKGKSPAGGSQKAGGGSQKGGGGAQKTGGSSQKPGGGNQKPGGAGGTQKTGPQKKKEPGQSSSGASGGGGSQQGPKPPGASASGYTGGKGRMMKERHKDKFKQRGADRKAQRANPFGL